MTSGNAGAGEDGGESRGGDIVNVGGRGEDNIEGVDRHAGGRGPVAGEE
jgi:hypothetical protein